MYSYLNTKEIDEKFPCGLGFGRNFIFKFIKNYKGGNIK